jgi:hypothetical protein
MKRLYRYYLFVGIPVLAVVLGTILFFDAIASTVNGNPHPQINYIIFGLIAAGCYQMTMHVVRINREAKHFYLYRKAVRSGASKDEIESMLEGVTRQYDVELLMQLIEELRGQSLSSVQHSAIEAELERFGARQNRRLMLSNFMSGMMVGMGLLGTFIGLLGALAEIGNLIGSFSLGAGMADPVAAITELVARLTAPMQAMGVAFSASLFGVLGSLIMGALMVAVRSASSDLVALVQSGTSLMLDITNEDSNSALPDFEPVTEALSALAEHSPLLRGLSVALDQSERRVRELMTGMGTLMAGMEASTHANQQLMTQLAQQAEQQEITLNLLSALQSNMNRLAERQTTMNEHSARTTDVMERQQVQLLEAIQLQRELFDTKLQEQQSMWLAQSNAQTELLSHQAEVFEKLMLTEHTHRKQALETISNTQATGIKKITDHLVHTQHMMSKHAASNELLMASLTDAEEQSAKADVERNRLIADATQTLKVDSQSRSQFVTRLESLLTETQSRNEQIIHMIATRVAAKAD